MLTTLKILIKCCPRPIKPSPDLTQYVLCSKINPGCAIFSAQSRTSCQRSTLNRFRLSNLKKSTMLAESAKRSSAEKGRPCCAAAAAVLALLLLLFRTGRVQLMPSASANSIGLHPAATHRTALPALLAP